MKKIGALIILCLIYQAGCIRIPPRKPAIPPDESIQAEGVLREFYAALQEGEYQAAADLYGGTYEVLAGMNPDLDPSDEPGLLAQGCQFNGFSCLQMGKVLSVEENDVGEYHFVVQFLTEKGEVFWLGPCCGADETEMPPISEFEISAARDDSVAYKAMDLPPYLP